MSKTTRPGEADPNIYACPDGAACKDTDCIAEFERRKADRMIVHKTHLDEDTNIETILFEVDGQFRVRVRDLDVGENVSLVKCVNRDQAFAKFREATEQGYSPYRTDDYYH